MNPMTAPFQMELVWNREFHFVPYGSPHQEITLAIRAAQVAENMGDGACVKKTRIVDANGKVVWQYGGLVK